MNRLYFKGILMVAALLVLMLMSPGCSKHTTKAQRNADKAMEKIEKEADKEYDATIKSHRNIQSKSTEKMMRQAKKRAKKINKSLRRRKR
jgi:vacuolar-type H+-ATPase subunit H